MNPSENGSQNSILRHFKMFYIKLQDPKNTKHIFSITNMTYDINPKGKKQFQMNTLYAGIAQWIKLLSLKTIIIRGLSNGKKQGKLLTV